MTFLHSIIDNVKTNYDYRFGTLQYDCVDLNLTGKCTYDCIFCECQKLDAATDLKIGRASCRERVCVPV